MRLAAIFLLLSSAIAHAADYQIQANIRYAHHAETVLDILQARAPALKNRPGVMVIHGGGWVEDDKESMVPDFCEPFIQHDFVVANVEYRLAKSALAPAAVEDVLDAAKWFADHAAEYKVDPGRIIVMGASAGGHLALLTAMLPASAGFGPTVKIAAVIDFYGMADVPDQLEGPDRQPYAAAWIPPGPDRMALARRLSPLSYVRKGLPPVLAIHGEADEYVPYAKSVELIKALKSAGNDAELITVSGGKHGFPAAQMSELWPQIFKWLKKRKIGA